MSAQTPIYGITYPTDSDLVRDIADHLKAEAQTVETALHEVDQRATPAGSTPVIAQTYGQLSQMSGVTGQTGYVTNDASYRNGVYIHDITGWERASDTLGDDLFDFANNANWSSQYRSWLSAGTVFLSLRLVRKTDWPRQSGIQSIEKIGNIKVPAFRPPWFIHAPAFASGTPNNAANSIGLRVDTDGSIQVETLAPNVGLNANGTIQATITWPCEWN